MRVLLYPCMSGYIDPTSEPMPRGTDACSSLQDHLIWIHIWSRISLREELINAGKASHQSSATWCSPSVVSVQHQVCRPRHQRFPCRPWTSTSTSHPPSASTCKGVYRKSHTYGSTLVMLSIASTLTYLS